MNSNFETKMAEIFDVIPSSNQELLPAETKSNLPVASNIDMDLDNDLVDAYEQTKSNLQELIETGKESMEEMLRIAKESEHPRAFEVYGTLLKTMVDANKELLSVQKQMREMDKNNGGGGDTVIDKAIFVGSTSELAKIIKGEGNR